MKVEGFLEVQLPGFTVEGPLLVWPVGEPYRPSDLPLHRRPQSRRAHLPPDALAVLVSGEDDPPLLREGPVRSRVAVPEPRSRLKQRELRRPGGEHLPAIDAVVKKPAQIRAVAVHRLLELPRPHAHGDGLRGRDPEAQVGVRRLERAFERLLQADFLRRIV